jgi:hypothetical protein
VSWIAATGGEWSLFSGTHNLLKLWRAGWKPGQHPASIPPAAFELGILTGNLSLDPIGSWLIPGPDDGKVSIDAARLEGAVAFKVVDATHTFIMNDPEVAEEVLRFLRTGRFSGG